MFVGRHGDGFANSVNAFGFNEESQRDGNSEDKKLRNVQEYELNEKAAGNVHLPGLFLDEVMYGNMTKNLV